MTTKFLRVLPGSRRRRPAPFAALVLALVALVLGTGSVAAHVGVTPREARPGASEAFTVRVPTERDEPTVRVRVEFPSGLVVSRFQPKPGWQRELERDAAGRITAVTWSGGRIDPAEYEDFAFIARTPAGAGKLSFLAFQAYAGGETVEWTEGEGAPRPAAIVEIKAAAAGSGANAANLSIEEAARTQTSTTGGATSAPGVAATARTAAPAGGASGVATTSVAPSADGAGLRPAAVAGPSGSDLPLFAAIIATLLAVLALALSSIALMRRTQAV